MMQFKVVVKTLIKPSLFPLNYHTHFVELPFKGKKLGQLCFSWD